MTQTESIALSGMSRQALFAAIKDIHPKGMAEIRANNRLFREFGLLEIEQIVQEHTPTETVTDPEVLAALNRKMQAAITTAIPLKETKDFKVSLVAVMTFRRYINALGELTMDRSRALAPLIDAVDAAFPPPDAELDAEMLVEQATKVGSPPAAS